MKKLLIAFILLTFFITSSCSTEDMLSSSYKDMKESDYNTIKAFSDVDVDYTHKNQMANLYYRYQKSNLLVPEYRQIDVRTGKIAEFAIIKELLRGPKLYSGILNNVFTSNVDVLNAVPIYNNKILAITLSENFIAKDLNTYDSQHLQDRLLMLNSIVLSITDSFSYQGVQIFIKPNDESKDVYRLDNSFLFQGNKLPMLPLLRDDSYIANHINVCKALINAWQKHDVVSIMAMINKSVDSKDLKDLLYKKDIANFEVYSGNIYNQGQNATVAVKLELANSIEYLVYPLKLVNDKGIWQVDYDNFVQLLNSIGD